MPSLEHKIQMAHGGKGEKLGRSSFGKSAVEVN